MNDDFLSASTMDIRSSFPSHIDNILGTPFLIDVYYLFLSFFFFLGIHEALDHLASFPSSRETISQPGIEPPTTPLDVYCHVPST